MRLRDIMTTPVVTLRENTTIKEAAETLLAHHITGAPVVDDDGLLAGVVSDADLIELEINLDPQAHARPIRRLRLQPEKIADVMTPEVVALPGDIDVGYAARSMLSAGIKRIPVVDGERVIGIVTRTDLLRILARPDDEIEKELQDFLDDEIVLLGRIHAAVNHGRVTLTGIEDRSTRRLAERVALSVPGVIDVSVLQD